MWSLKMIYSSFWGCVWSRIHWRDFNLKSKAADESNSRNEWKETQREKFIFLSCDDQSRDYRFRSAAEHFHILHMIRTSDQIKMIHGLVCSFFWQFPVIFGHFTNKRSKFISTLVYCGSQFSGLPFLYTFLYAGKILVKSKNLLLLATRHPPQGEDMSGERDEGGAENKRWQWEVVLNDKLQASCSR